MTKLRTYEKLQRNELYSQNRPILSNELTIKLIESIFERNRLIHFLLKSLVHTYLLPIMSSVYGIIWRCVALLCYIYTCVFTIISGWQRPFPSGSWTKICTKFSIRTHQIISVQKLSNRCLLKNDLFILCSKITPYWSFDKTIFAPNASPGNV